jgi:site-specific DNA-methyltransferase (adenine-specific)
MSDLELRFGDCLSELKLLENDSVDLVCTDPPYGYSFMGKDWDKAVPSVEIWRECLRVLKPGCFAFVMSAPRSDVQCEMILKLKEAGFEVGFSPIYWAYASGFPKACNISKMVDKRLGVEPEIIGKQIKGSSPLAGNYNGEWTDGQKDGEFNLTKPSSNEAKLLDGLFGGFQPKPAVEVVLVVMKPIEEKTYVEQALKNGHGGTWLGRCRIPYESNDDIIKKNPHTLSKGSDAYDSNCYGKYNATNEPIDYTKQDGRFPANLLVSDNVLDNGVPTSQGHWSKSKTTGFGEFGNGKSEYFGVGNKSKVEGFSRYFSLDAWWDKAIKELPEEQRKTFPFLITPKASKSEKNKGCEKMDDKLTASSEFRPNHLEKTLNGESGNPFGRWTPVKNNHPTVKPLKLMQYLVTLGCNKGEIVLDPFVGSGTTCIASKLQGRKSIGVEMCKEYFEIAKARCKSFSEQVTIVEDCL